MTTTIERDGPVTTIVRARTHARNAMDPASAEALVEALLAFDRDPDQSVAVLWGADGAPAAHRRPRPRARYRSHRPQGSGRGVFPHRAVRAAGGAGKIPRSRGGAGTRDRPVSASVHARRPPLGVAARRPVRTRRPAVGMGLFLAGVRARRRRGRRALCARQGPPWRVRRYLNTDIFPIACHSGARA